MNDTESGVERYIYTRRKSSDIERAHLVETDNGNTVDTRCGLTYQKKQDYMGTCTLEDLPRLVCRNCRRSLRSERSQ